VVEPVTWAPQGTLTAMPPFFFPMGDGQGGEDTYQRLRRETELRMGHAPRSRRIMEVWMRRGNLDCVTAVGAPDPVRGEIVTAIFDMGLHQPFIVYRQHPTDPGQHPYDVVDCYAYTVSEFAQ
jgi:hypothetical protein